MALEEKDRNAALPTVRVPQVAHLVTSEHNIGSPEWDTDDSASVRSSKFLGSANNSQALVRSSSNVSTVDQLPAIQSVFPNYNPTLPLSRQQYSLRATLASRPTQSGRHQAKRAEYSPSLYSRPCSMVKERSLEPAASSPKVTIHCPTKVSTAEELLNLWTVASGQRVHRSSAVFSLALLWSVE